ncbi:MAG: ABC transporter permease [Candidatus Sulfotelmatobacter sp.]|jgi:putative ABC transport system permease protein|nr:MAG: ABC transporter permease [Acidobacteria bacterium 13_1_20CM_4_56_7]PYQ42999.1 MAG: ABC transporter permease [Acidobacteriota bacterium]
MPIATSSPVTAPRRFTIGFSEILNFAYDAFSSNKLQFILTSLAMAVGTASVILVVTIGLTGKQYILRQIQSIGANMIYADYQGGSQRIDSTPDPMTVEDVDAVRQQVPAVVAASPTIALNDRISVGGGRQSDILVLGVSAEYRRVRNLVLLAGRFFDQQDSSGRNKVGVITDKLAGKLFGSPSASIGQIIKLSGGLPFTVVGVFKESVDTFGQSEIQEDTMLIPHTVSRFFTPTGAVYQIYFSAASPQDVGPATAAIKRVLQSRHRAESVYSVQNLTQLLSVAGRIADALTLVLMLVALVTLLVSGIGIMNIMLATVSSRIREIGIRKAIGATNREIRFQFLAEAILISLTGGIAGILTGLALPYSLRFFTDYRVPISGLSAIIAILISSIVGIIFGTVPASRASQLDPVESLRYE